MIQPVKRAAKKKSADQSPSTKTTLDWVEGSLVRKLKETGNMENMESKS